MSTKRRQALALLAILSGCTDAPSPPAPEPKRQVPEPKPEMRVQPAPATRAGPAPGPQAPAPGSGEAGDILRTYYRLIDERLYSEAHSLREPNGADAAAFAAHFDRFGSQKVTIGQPSEPAEAGDWLYVEVPVQTYGSMKDGSAFGSAGTVTLRRRKSGGAWRIFTKG